MEELNELLCDTYQAVMGLLASPVETGGERGDVKM